MIDENKRIQSVERALLLLEALAAEGGEARLTDLAERVGLNKSTLHGLLNTLAAMGYVTRRGTRYGLGLRIREIAQPLADQDFELKERFAPALEGLAKRCGETCYLAVPCGSREYLYVDAIEGAGSLRFGSPRGRREGLTTSAIGKVFLAFNPDLLRSLRRADKVGAALETELKEIVEVGYALDLEQAEPGLNCLAIPLRRHGRVEAALGVAGSSKILDEPTLNRLARQVFKEMFDIIKL
ncbi:IclR family transcriptional regulator [Marinobacter xestospongiae]|uniref:IclR family transcriptional regulator n=1 Tax=Marinobacter xestospongiae TaxID=994319 RepID=UPI002005DE9F|nr:IclR family transcriptional regulator [Marinobacter xestospongiae]MCK7569026.1 IclR family transcriptional regulator [Marinobacter xestospongiae]